jgi:hypothetical protein
VRQGFLIDPAQEFWGISYKPRRLNAAPVQVSIWNHRFFPLSRTSASAINFPTMRQNFCQNPLGPFCSHPKKEENTLNTQNFWKVLGCWIMLNLPRLAVNVDSPLPTPDVPGPLMLRNSGKEPAQLCHGSCYLPNRNPGLAWLYTVDYSIQLLSTFCSSLNPKLSDKILCPSSQPVSQPWSPSSHCGQLRKFGRVSESLLEHRGSSCRFYWGTQWWWIWIIFPFIPISTFHVRRI